MFLSSRFAICPNRNIIAYAPLQFVVPLYSGILSANVWALKHL